MGPACPTASQWHSGPCPAGRAPRHQQSGGSAAGKPVYPRSTGVRWENILYRSVAHATWSLAAETGWGETKLKSILCLINDCLYRESRRRTLGSALSWRHIWAGMWRRCCGAFVVLDSKEPGSFLLLSDAFFHPIPGSGAGSMAEKPPRASRTGGGGLPARREVQCPSVHPRHPSGRFFLPLVSCLRLEHRCSAHGCAGASASRCSWLAPPACPGSVPKMSRTSQG